MVESVKGVEVRLRKNTKEEGERNKMKLIHVASWAALPVGMVR